MDVKTARHQLISFLCLLLLGVFVRGREAFKRLCHDTSIDILTQTGVKIEDVEISRVELPLVQLNGRVRRPRFKLSFQFKTRSKNGVLFYSQTSGYPDELIAMILKDGNIIYKIRCSAAHVDVIIPTEGNYKLNDGRWHNVSYVVKYRSVVHNGFIHIDGFSNSKRYEVSCQNMTSLTMGGINPRDGAFVNELKNVPNHFEGCIRRVVPPTALRTPPKYYAVSNCPSA